TAAHLLYATVQQLLEELFRAVPGSPTSSIPFIAFQHDFPVHDHTQDVWFLALLGGNGRKVHALNFPEIRFGILRRFRIADIPAVVSLYPFVVSVLLHIMFEDTDSKIDVVFNFKYVDTFFI